MLQKPHTDHSNIVHSFVFVCVCVLRLYTCSDQACSAWTVWKHDKALTRSPQGLEHSEENKQNTVRSFLNSLWCRTTHRIILLEGHIHAHKKATPTHTQACMHDTFASASFIFLPPSLCQHILRFYGNIQFFCCCGLWEWGRWRGDSYSSFLTPSVPCRHSWRKENTGTFTPREN